MKFRCCFSVRRMSKEEVDPYTIKSSADGFAAKAKNVFDCLQNLEEKHNAYEKARKDNSSGDESDQCLLKDDPSKDDVETINPAFKKPPVIQRGHPRSFQPRRPVKSKGRMPDFNDGPVKWKKYSLEDVDEVNDTSNRQAAYAFLEERRKLREGEITETKADVQSNACSKGQFTFTKRSKDTKQLENDNNGSKTDSSKIKIDKKLDLIESETDITKGDNYNCSTGTSEENPVTVPVFKFRKSGKRNIRSRDTNSDEDEAT